MQHNTAHPLIHRQQSTRASGPQRPGHGPNAIRSVSGMRRLRSDESWIDVSSQPSSSSLSSVATDDHGLRLQQEYNNRRRRRMNPSTNLPYTSQARSSSAAGSSQEEYEESESESDRIMTSSTEGLEPQFSDGISPPIPTSSASEPISSEDNDDDDDDENSTALGVLTTEPVFTPQPNAFSHPPQGATITQTRTTETRSSYFQTQRVSSSRPPAHSYPQHRNRSHTPYNVISPSHQADHDAALRASLSTLLSCAAAARGLPKRDVPTQPSARHSNRIEPSTLRMVPESVLREEAARPRPTARQPSTGSITDAAAREKVKRKASTSRDRRDKKKTRRGSIEDMGISPTLLTWVVSAGVVVLVSAISFSAGYTVGKEVGKVEAGLGGVGHGAIGGKEVGRGLRKLRLGTPTVA